VSAHRLLITCFALSLAPVTADWAAPAAAPSLATDVPQAVRDDWAGQDGLYADGSLRTDAVRRVIDELGEGPGDLGARFESLRRDGAKPSDPRWYALYVEACRRRRAARLAPYRSSLRRVVFTKHYDLGGSHYAYTEGQSDAQAERHFRPGSALCLLEMDGLFGRVRTLIDDPDGVIRDPDVSYDGRRVLFAWKRGDRTDDYHLYEMTVADGEVRQLTAGLGFADYEPAYLPDGHIVFNSTRCVQTVDCWWTEVSNLYTCDGDGRYLRRLSFDQVHTNYPTVTPDGRVIYTRWDYSDRGQIFPQGLFQMYPDGTGQTAIYGNNSWFPTTILHARAIPGTEKIVCVFSGHHTRQKGWLGILDPTKGREENRGAQLIAPVRVTEAVHVDKYGQQGDQFQYPYPLSETAFLVTFKPAGAKRPFALYFMTRDGRRELLAWDPKIFCNQPAPLAPRPKPTLRARVPDYREETGVFYVQDVYEGPGLAGIERGTVKRLRVVALEFRAAGIGRNGSRGPAGGALSSTPPACRNGAWDVKRVLGSTPVYEDGSACFRVPARTPVYFQALDSGGRAVQTMRSWATLQPGEAFACVGCHESKNTAPPVRAATEALRRGPRDLEPFYGPPRGFSFPKEIQPILDRHCVRCHNDRSVRLKVWAEPADPAGKERAFSLLDTRVRDEGSKRFWSDAYLALTQNGRSNRVVNWLSAQSVPPMRPLYFAGSAKSDLITMLEAGHNGVRPSRREMDKIACWIDLLVPFCGDYTEAAAWNDAQKRTYAHFMDKRRRMEMIERENIRAWIKARTAARTSAE